MPKWLLALTARSELPLADSRQPWARVMLAGMPWVFMYWMAASLYFSMYSSRVCCCWLYPGRAVSMRTAAATAPVMSAWIFLK